MDDTWRAGDLALCIKQGKWRDSATKDYVEFGPKAGALLTVCWVMDGEAMGRDPGVLLNFAAWPRDFFVARNFVKITPDAERLDEEAAAAIRSGTPVAEPAAQ
ncbi:hypothetical protein [Alteraurantiacibacter palmitatis]|uniref:Uncharacterized protein n=1 Tax=Alteraurantiacibacter palmitatis TaxID=2054628 RepID=A0ABV7E957_9SPHN